MVEDLIVDLDGPGFAETLRRRLGLSPGDPLPQYSILRRSIDARKKGRVHLVYSLQLGEGTPEETPPAPPACRRRIGRQPLVIGTGPAGLFAALALVEKGYRPLVVDRGRPLARRVEDAARLRRQGILDPESNILFGEGGAGTFSDGKLTHRSRHHLVRKVFSTLVEAGAPPEIVYEQKPHVGTDRLRAIVIRIRKKIEDGGGTFLFGARLDDLEISGGALRAARVGDDRVETEALFLATGHSARDTYRMLEERGVALAAKALAVGLRIEHDQALIDRAQFGRFAGHPALGPADYRLSWTDPASGRGAYSFCNCPGGVVVPAMHEHGTVNTNGMSRHARNSGLSNSALVVSVPVDDFPEGSPLAGIAYQRDIEERGFEAGGGDFSAPAQHTGDFLANRPSRSIAACTYRPGVVPGDLGRILPPPVAASLRRAIGVFARRITGFQRSILVGPETRTSSPVRILRDRESMESVNVKGLFPLGEGSGYSGGIVSSAVDALRAVERIEAFHA